MAVTKSSYGKILINYDKVPETFMAKEFCDITGVSAKVFYGSLCHYFVLSQKKRHHYNKNHNLLKELSITDYSILMKTNYSRLLAARMNKFSNVIRKLPNTFTIKDYAKIAGISDKHASTNLRNNLDKCLYYTLKQGNKDGIKNTIYRKTNKEITMPNDSATILSRESLTQMSLIQQLMSEFKELPNNEKVVFICTLFPFVDAANVIVKINEQYPNYIFAKLAENDKLFHPIAGIVEIFDVNAHSFKFYGNGTKWESDRNGYLIVNGKKDAKRTVFLDLDDYVKHMKKQG